MRAIGIFLFFIVYLFTARWYFLCQYLDICEPETVEVRERSLDVTTTDSVLMSGFEQFAFHADSISPRLTAGNLRFLDSLTEHFVQDPYSELLITGRFEESEMGLSEGFFENLGLARADVVRGLLMRQGMPEGKIRLDYEQTDTSGMKRPLSFAVYPHSGWPQGREAAHYQFNQMTFAGSNFPVDDESYLPGDAFGRYARALDAYRADHPDMLIVITGHTNDSGSRSRDKREGLKLAKSAGAQLRELQIDLPVTFESKGSTQPIAPDDDEAEKAKNRRVTFTILDQQD